MSKGTHRYISNLTKDTYALILAGGRGSRLHELTDWRAKPAVFFGGKFRIIDFPLSSLVTLAIVLKGNSLCAALTPYISKISPLAVSFP